MFDWTRWPYDPADVGREVLEGAVAALESEADAGLQQVDRAASALRIAVSMMAAKVGNMERRGETLSDLDHAHRDVRRLLEEAMDAVYSAARIIDGL